MEPVSLSYSETGKALGGEGTPLSRTSIWRLVRCGGLEKVRVGGRAMITVASIKRLVSQHEAA
jgi:hypothetical protein